MQNINFSFSILSDIIVLLLLISFAFMGRKRGFIKMISGVLVLILSITVAGMLTKWTTPYISTTFVEPQITQLLLPEFENSPSVDSPQDIKKEDTDFISSSLSKMGLSGDTINSAIENFKKEAVHSVESAITSLSESVSSKVTYGILFIVYFLICMLVFSLLVRLLNLAAKLPVISFFNRTGGFIIGLIWGYLVILIVSSILLKYQIVISPEIAEKTVILKFISTQNPLSLLPIWK